jgi:hypothetical protein
LYGHFSYFFIRAPGRSSALGHRYFSERPKPHITISLKMKKVFQTLADKFSTIRTILPLLVLAVEIISFIDDKLKSHATKINGQEESPLGV